MDKAGSLLDRLCTPHRGIDCETLRNVCLLAIEIAREGREGRKVGTMFVVGDVDHTLPRSQCLILDPLANHPEHARRIDDSNMRETAKELAQLDGAFIVSDKGVFLSACRYINASSEGLDFPLGLGSRHLAAASISSQTDAVAVVVSESAVVRVYDNGTIIAEIVPELGMLSKLSTHIRPPFSENTEDQVTVRVKDE